MTIKTRCSKRAILARLGPIAVFVTVSLLAPAPVQAIPAFARQFNAKCSTCHEPLPPRLNNLGITFKRLGYRLPDVDDQGRLVLKDKPSQSLLENFSLIGDIRLEKFRGKPTPLSMHEVELVGGGTAGPHLSFSTEVAWEAGEFSLDRYDAQVLLGRPEANFTARFGQVAPLLWDKFGSQRLGIARASVLNRRVPVGAFVGYRPRDPMEGLELGVNLTRAAAEGGTMRSTFLSLGLYNGLTQAGNDFGENNGSKDVLAQVLHLFGEANTIGALWYHGKATKIGTTAFDDTYSRFGVFGNYVLGHGADVLGGFMTGRDEATISTIGRISSRSWFLELDQTIAPRTAAFFRYDRFEPRRPEASVTVGGPTLGVACQALDHLLLTGEYTGQKVGTKQRGRDLVVRATVIY